MKWSWKLGEIAGIGVFLHATFLILLGWIGVVHFVRGDDLGDALHGFVFLAALFGIIVLHELGHALAARRYGIQTRDITLLPIGGVARLERMPEDPRQELVVAAAGPAVNVALAILCLAGIWIFAGIGGWNETLNQGLGELSFLTDEDIELNSLSDVPVIGANFLAKMLVVNVILVLFNMLPAFPMDGGRVLRALLAMRMDYVQATQIAATIGQGMALFFGFIGLFYNPFLVFIAFFVWMGAAAEASMAGIRSALGGIPIRRAMITEFRTVSPDDQLGDVISHILAGFQQDFPVVDDGRLVGMLVRGDLLKSLAESGKEEKVKTVMRSEFQQASPSEMLEGVFQRLQECDCHSLPVVERGEVVGVIDMENLGEFIAIRSVLKSAGPPPREAFAGTTAGKA